MIIIRVTSVDLETTSMYYSSVTSVIFTVAMSIVILISPIKSLKEIGSVSTVEATKSRITRRSSKMHNRNRNNRTESSLLINTLPIGHAPTIILGAV